MTFQTTVTSIPISARCRIFAASCRSELEIGPPDDRRRVKSIENLITGERHTLEWGGVRLRIDQDRDPALLFRCFA